MCEPICWPMALLCFCDSRLLHHLSQVWSVQQCGTCIAWTWKWFNSEVHSYTFTIFTVFCDSESNSYRSSNRCLTSNRTLKMHFCQCDIVWHSAMKVDTFQKITKGNWWLVSMSLWSDAKCVNLFVLCVSAWLLCIYIYYMYLCICREVCVSVHISSAFLFLDLQSRMTFRL